MKEINCLADILAHTPRVRVIKENDENYGKEFDIAVNDYENKLITISCPSLAEYDYSEIQFLTPVQYEGRFIGFGDKVNWWEVFDYIWVAQWWRVRIFNGNKDYNLTDVFFNYQITSFEPLHQLTPKIELSTEELVEELRRRGVVTSGNIINN